MGRRILFRIAVGLLAALPLLELANAQTAPEAPKGPVTVDAESIEGVSEVELNARGNVELKRDDTTVFSDRLKYNQELGLIEADGGVRLQRPLDRISGPRLRYNLNDQTGVFEEPTYLMRRDLPARGKASRVEFLGDKHYRLRDATFTTCEPGQDDWQLEAEELELDYENDEGYAKWPKLRFLDTPIIALPFASFPLENKRRSGFLIPYYAQTSQRGFETGIPYYWNIAPERDITLTPVFTSKRGGQLKGEARYLGQSYDGELRLEYMPDDKAIDAEDTKRWGTTFQHAQQFFTGLTGRIDYNRVSDDRYFVDFSSRVREVSQRILNREGVLNYSGTVGDQGFGLQARAQSFQTLQDPLAPIVPPYYRLPQLNFSAARNDIGGWADAALPVEFVRFEHPTLVEAGRSQVNPALSVPFLMPGGFFTPKIGAHYAAYDIDRRMSGPMERQEVTVPWASLDAGLVFERPVNGFGGQGTQTLEPRIYYLYAPYKDQDAIPIFDTALADFNYAQLFSENRFVGGDRFGDADQVTYAITSRLLGMDGQEVLRATLGQRYYQRNERVGLTPTSNLRSVDSSSVLASIGGRLSRTWAFDTTVEYEPRQDRPDRLGAALRYSPEIAKVLNASYRFTRNDVKQIDISGQWPIAAGWYGVGRYNYSIQDDRLVDGVAGVEYNAGCWVFRAVFHRLQAATQVATSAFYIQIEFNGVGQIGTDEAVTLLKRQVPGYSVTNPTDRAFVPPSLQSQLPFRQVY